MSELNLILPCCVGKYCVYNSGLADGYALGILTVIMIFIFMEIINIISDVYTSKEDNSEVKEENKKNN